MDIFAEKSRVALLLEHFAVITDFRQSCKVMYPLPEILFLVVCGTICDNDDYEGICDWGEAHLAFLRQFGEFHHGIPCADWLRTLMNRIDPDLFTVCFSSWVAEAWPGLADQIALDGKTSRRTHNRREGQPPLHLVSAFATNLKLVLGQQAVDEKSNEITAIPLLLERLDVSGALVSIDAMGCNPNIARDIRDAGGDYLLALKKNQPTLYNDVESYFKSAPSSEIMQFQTVGKEHGRIEIRRHFVSHEADWFTTERSYPDAPRFPDLAAIGMVEARIEHRDHCTCERRYYLTSRKLSAERLAEAVRAHWQIENGLHWSLDVTFDEDRSRLRTGHGAKNMAVVRHFAFNLVRSLDDKRSLKRRRKKAAYDPDYLRLILQNRPR
jgi:predicted transposase YbfD/YdcC